MASCYFVLWKRCVLSCNEPPIVCSPLSVVQNDKGKRRSVINLQYVNQFLPIQKFKVEGLNLVPQMFRKDYFFTLDLKSGYIMLIFMKIVGHTLVSHGV